MLETSIGLLNDVVDAARRAGTDLARVEIKSAIGGLPTKSLAPTISAFANTSGGVLILGLDERTRFNLAEGFDAKAIASQLADRLRPPGRSGPDAQSLVYPVPQCQVEVVDFEGAQLVVAEIGELAARDKPCYVTTQGKERGSYRRLADGDHRMSTYEVFQLSTLIEQPTFDVAPVVDASRADLDPRLVERLLERIRRSGSSLPTVSSSDDDMLARLNVLADDRRTPTLAGLLTLGVYPQQFFPQLMVSVSVYPGSTKGDIIDGLRLSDRQDCDGPIPDIVDKAINAVLRNLGQRREMRGAGALDLPEIPVAVLREAIVNAVMHRDYSPMATGRQVMIDVFPDRIDIISPGGLWGGRQIEDIVNGDSDSRNRALSRLLTDVPQSSDDRVVCENRGTGVQTMMSQMRGHGHAVPEFRDLINSFVVRLDRHGLLNPATSEWLSGVGAAALDRAHQLTLVLAESGRRLTRDTLHRQLAIDSAEADAVLSDLVEAGWLVYPRTFDDGFGLGPRTQAANERLWPPQTGDPEARSASSIDALLAEIGAHEQLTAREMAAATGLALVTVRRLLRQLLSQGLVVATAAPTSRYRAYRLASADRPEQPHSAETD